MRLWKMGERLDEEEEEEGGAEPSDWLDWLDGSRKLRKEPREGNWEEEVVGMGVGEALGILGTTLLSFLGSISLLTQERIFSLSILRTHIT